MDYTWDTLCQLTKQLAQRNQDYWNEIIGIGVTGQGDGAWMVDGEGHPARNAILWNDTRTKFTAIENKEALDQYCQDNQITPIFQGANYYILKWVKENEPENFKRIARVIHCKDWLNYKLTGNIATDFADTSTTMLRTPKQVYDYKVLEYLGLGDCEALFAPLQYSDEVTGTVSKEAAELTGLKPGIPVVTGSIDIAGVAAGAGAVEKGDTVAIIGTTCCTTMVLERSQLDYSDRRGSILCHQTRDRFLRLLAMSNGTASLDWARMTLLPTLSFAEIEAGIRDIEIGSEGVIFQPYLYGERAPFRDSTACGSFIGITARHNTVSSGTCRL
jgi:sugar (pentulose or hexulose) kinase